MTTTSPESFTLPESIKPRLRGWLHAGTLPVALVAGFVLVALGPTLQARLAAVIYAISSALLFGISATYHRGTLSPRAGEVLRRLDHANIYLIIAGTYTPFAMLALSGPARAVVLGVIWGGAVAGVLFRVLWIGAPRWLSTALYIGLGWTAVFVLPQLLEGAGVAAVALIFVGGLLYTAGGVVYGLRRPDPSPRWFGFHEVFHALTVAAYVVQYVAVSLVVYAAA
ncbi:PAQR family membrane homeostasis protein TrhA [Streptosporangium sp. NBC_01756]|uniref:PAQR family membrane homeostasis protein TrhA n=1 Tax=Streptosporangium sp. NBC_01756 TaxID=2975950 RepID=UPI002DD99780|nr:hemolysin III family protein [Streptosporangium sp. NBC_01756]WSC88448.1 hemolysin III family protein [Streptosporangium sp. NBC_01756]